MYTNISLPRNWEKGKGCIATVSQITPSYFNSELTEFRKVMENKDVETVDRAWRAICMLYESLDEDISDTFIDTRFRAIMDEWSLRKRLLTSDENHASLIIKNHFNHESML